MKDIPLWFREGVETFVANGGADYTNDIGVFSIISSEVKKAYLSGKTDYWFKSTDPLDAVDENGAGTRLLYRIGALFVHFIHDFDSIKFDKLIQMLLTGNEFDQAFHFLYGEDLDSYHEKFSTYLYGNSISGDSDSLHREIFTEDGLFKK